MTYSAHMVLHVVLSELVPLFLALAMRRREPWRAPALLAWAVGVVATIGASIPPAYALAQESAVLGAAMGAGLVLAGIVFWTPVVGRARLGAGATLLYLITACFATTLAGAYIAFSATTTDQQVAGLIMWVPCCLVFLSVAIATVMRTLRGERTMAHENAN